jgi:hypothetical protein
VSAMKKPWKVFEELVTAIEKIHGPVDAVIKSPDRILDKTTGQLREVDASIRYKIDSADVLVTVECRDRNSSQDITWLEQIKSKKESIGANLTIVVSREGFYGPAIKYASRYGIELRVLSELDHELVTSKIFIGGNEIPVKKFIYTTTDGRFLGGASCGFKEGEGGMSMIFGAPTPKKKE